VKDEALDDIALYRLTGTTIWECPNTLESGSKKTFDFVVFFLLRKFIV
jgi:hypothetical protein